ncbi:hypothetical protein [Streptomyces sp. NPDC054837]
MRQAGAAVARLPGAGTHWAPVWEVMRTLAELHGPEHARLVVWFG